MSPLHSLWTEGLPGPALCPLSRACRPVGTRGSQPSARHSAARVSKDRHLLCVTRTPETRKAARGHVPWPRSWPRTKRNNPSTVQQGGSGGGSVSGGACRGWGRPNKGESKQRWALGWAVGVHRASGPERGATTDQQCVDTQAPGKCSESLVLNTVSEGPACNWQLCAYVDLEI